MDESAPAPRGDAAWKLARDGVAQRNADAHKKAQSNKNTKDGVIADRERRAAADEAAQLRDLNKRIAKRGAGG